MAIQEQLVSVVVHKYKNTVVAEKNFAVKTTLADLIEWLDNQLNLNLNSTCDTVTLEGGPTGSQV